MCRPKTAIVSISRFARIALIAVALCISVLRIHAQEATPAVISSELLVKWKHIQRISLDMDRVDPVVVFKEIGRQSGVKIENGTGVNAPPMTLKVKDAPVWQALAEASIACKTGLELGDKPGLDKGSRSVSFTGKAWSPPESRPRVFDRYQLLGPFLVGMCWSNELLQENEKGHPGIFIHVLGFPTEGHAMGIVEITLRDENGKRWPLKSETKVPASIWQHGETYFRIPAGLEKKKLDLYCSFEASVYLNPKEFVLPITKRHIEKFDDFGGMSIRVVKAASQKSPAVECTLDWNMNLNEADLKYYKKYAEMERRFSLTPADTVKAFKFMESKRDEIRLLHVTYFAALDRDGKAVRPVSTENDGDRVELRFPKGQRQPVNLRLRVAERKQVTAAFEFKNVFAKSRMAAIKLRPFGATR